MKNEGLESCNMTFVHRGMYGWWIETSMKSRGGVEGRTRSVIESKAEFTFSPSPSIFDPFSCFIGNTVAWSKRHVWTRRWYVTGSHLLLFLSHHNSNLDTSMNGFLSMLQPASHILHLRLRSLSFASSGRHSVCLISFSWKMFSSPLNDSIVNALLHFKASLKNLAP